MAFLKLMTSEQVKTATACSTVVPQGKCGDCGSPAFDNVCSICKDCAPYYGVSLFPTYTYPSELLFNEAHHCELRKFFMQSN